MNPYLRESDLPAAFANFVDSCLQQFRDIGFDLTLSSGAFELRLTDAPQLNRADSESYNGRFWLNNPSFGKESYWPCSDSHGVYLFFDKANEARYVGKAENWIGNRLGAHMGARGPNCDYPQRAFRNASYIISLPFRRAPFLAPAFESFLLGAYRFPDNKHGARGSIQAVEPGGVSQ